jgi:hypothetical protein
MATVVPAVRTETSRRWFAGLSGALVTLVLIKLAIHLYAAQFYGYFVDELYFIACGDHLAWGYVDQPPLIALIVKVERVLFGDSLQSIRLFSGVAGAATVLLAGLIARELGGRRFAQFLAGLCVLVAPICLSMNHYISMNAFEPLFWMGCAYILIRIIKTGNQKLWLAFGVVAGLGLLNKHSMGMFGGGVVLGLLLTEHRRMFLKPWIWLGGLIAFLIFLPNLIWNIDHHFPFLELMANIRRNGRNTPLTHFQFLSQVTQIVMPLSLPIWLAGLWSFMAGRVKQFRVLGWTFLAVMSTMLLPNSRPYYMAPVFPMMFAAGAVAIESWMAKRNLRWPKPAMVSALVVGGLTGAPLAIPVLPAETFIRYMKLMRMEPPRIETHKLGPLPQFYADMYGWEEMVAVVAKAYNALPPEQRPKTAIFGGNFGQAGAIDLFGKKYGLPKAIGTHQNYYFWGPREYTGESMIVMGARLDELTPLFDSVVPVGTVYHSYAMPYEQFTVYYCTRPKQTLQQLWPTIKNWS